MNKYVYSPNRMCCTIIKVSPVTKPSTRCKGYKMEAEVCSKNLFSTPLQQPPNQCSSTAYQIDLDRSEV